MNNQQDAIEMEAKVRVGNGKTVTMIGSPDAIDKITMQMRTHRDLLRTCELALTNFQELPQPTRAQNLAMFRLRAVISSSREEQTQ